MAGLGSTFFCLLPAPPLAQGPTAGPPKLVAGGAGAGELSHSSVPPRVRATPGPPQRLPKQPLTRDAHDGVSSAHRGRAPQRGRALGRLVAPVLVLLAVAAARGCAGTGQEGGQGERQAELAGGRSHGGGSRHKLARLQQSRKQVDDVLVEVDDCRKRWGAGGPAGCLMMCPAAASVQPGGIHCVAHRRRSGSSPTVSPTAESLTPRRLGAASGQGCSWAAGRAAPGKLGWQGARAARQDAPLRRPPILARLRRSRSVLSREETSSVEAFR